MDADTSRSGDTPLSERLPEATVCLAPDLLRQNVESACRRGLPQVPCMRPHGRQMVICAGGPSLRRSLHEVRRRQRQQADVVAVNATSGFLLESEIIPRAVVLADPQEVLAEQFAVDPQITYLVASQCRPEVFDRLEGCEVLLWHCQADDEQSWITPFYPEPVLTENGTTAALRMIDVAFAMGFRDIHFYGLDGSFEADEKGWLRHHAYQQTVDDMPACIIIKAKDETSEREFLTRADYARQADEFMTILLRYHRMWKVGRLDQLNVQVHGDGLIPYIWRKRRHELV